MAEPKLESSDPPSRNQSPMDSKLSSPSRIEAIRPPNIELRSPLDTHDAKSLKSMDTINTHGTGSPSPQKRKVRKGLTDQVVNMVYAYDHDTPQSYLKEYLSKIVQKEDKHSFGSEIFRHVKKEYNSKLKQVTKIQIKCGLMDDVFPEDGKPQNIDLENQKNAINAKKKDLEK